VLRYAGASLVRDTVDKRIVHDVSTGTATYMDGGNGSTNGIIDTQDAVGGWPELTPAAAPIDSDRDGMPDSWEEENGLNPDNGGDAQLKTVDGFYPNLEVYLQSLVAHIVNYQNEGEPPEDTTSNPTAFGSVKFPADPPNSIRMYFDAGTKELLVQHDAAIKNVGLYSISGVQVANQRFNASEIRLQIPWVQSGIFFLRIEDEHRSLFTRKIPILN